jgi:uncharacterized repeat protein (TIGR01451 family)
MFSPSRFTSLLAPTEHSSIALKFLLLRYRCLLFASLIIGGGLINTSMVAAASPTPGTVIENQATGSFVDTADNLPKTVASDVVKVTVAEVAGITVTAGILPTVANGAVSNFDFTITNAGNDPTKFFLPKDATVSGGTQGTLQIIAYIDAAGTTNTLTTPIDITASGDTGSFGIGAALGTLGGNTTSGSIPAGAAIVVRVPVAVTAANGSSVTVTLGNTGGQPTASNTPYVLGANGTGSNDLYTVDNADTVADEAAGAPINGDASGHRQEASAIQTVNVIGGAFVNGTCQPDGLVWVSGGDVASSKINQIGSYRISNSTFTNVVTTAKDWGDIAWATDNKLYGVEYTDISGSPNPSGLYRIDPITGQTTFITDLSMLGKVANSLTGIPNGGLIIGGDFYSKVYRYELSNSTNPPVLWHDFGAGFPAGDFIPFNGKVYIAWNTGASYQLFEVTVDANYNYISHQDLGALPDGSRGLALVLNKIYAVAGTNIHQINSIPTSPVVTIPTTVVPNMPAPYFLGGASGTEEPFGGCSTPTPVSISGTVFEDPDYGGGAGRPLSTPATSGRNGAVVELYSSTGAYIKSITTSGGGNYTFTGVTPGDYQIRVVNSTVTSSRPNSSSITGLVAVQTFRTDASVTAGTVTPVTDHVGGEKPAETDAPVNTTATLATLNGVTNQEVQSLTAVKVGSSAVIGIDFGYNFDTIVNTNDLGQGSLRQFVTNSNALGNTGLQQVGSPIGQEVSIFMIADGAARNGLTGSYPSGLNGTGGNNNTAIIALNSQLVITDSNTSIDGRTQTQNVSDSNSGNLGTGGKVGTDGLTLDPISKPEIVLDFSAMPVVDGNFNSSGGGSNGIVIQGQNATLAGFAFYGYRIQQGLGGMNKGTIWVSPTVNDAGKATLTQLLGGTLANGSSPPANTLVGYGFQATGSADIFNNYFAYLADAGTFGNSTGVVSSSAINFYNNELVANGPKNTSTSNASGVYADQLETEDNSKNIKIYGNLIRNATSASASGSQGKGLQISTGSSAWVQNNTFSGNYQAGIMSAGIDDTIEKNIITDSQVDGAGNFGSGIAIVKYNSNSGLRNKISQNSIFSNISLGIDLATYNGSTFSQGVNGNDGIVNTNNTGAQAGNTGINYPIITYSTLASGTLTVKGFVGKSPISNPTFANATVELFVAADDGNNNGEIIAGDTRSKSHGEGKTYIGTCVADGNGLFGTSSNPCTFNNSATLSLASANNITATATDAAGNTSEFSATPNIKAQLLLVKRVTAIKDGETGNITSFGAFVDDTTSNNKADDNHCNWPTATSTAGTCTNNYTVGEITPGKVKPGDEVEYTIYYLNSGENKATQARVCDRLDSNLIFQKDPDAAHVGKGISLVQGNSSIQYLTNGADTDPGQITTPVLATSCNLGILTNTNLSSDVVVVDVGTTANPLIGSAGAGIPTASYGYIRFKVKIRQ